MHPGSVPCSLGEPMELRAPLAGEHTPVPGGTAAGPTASCGRMEPPGAMVWVRPTLWGRGAGRDGADPGRRGSSGPTPTGVRSVTVLVSPPRPDLAPAPESTHWRLMLLPSPSPDRAEEAEAEPQEGQGGPFCWARGSSGHGAGPRGRMPGRGRRACGCWAQTSRLRGGGLTGGVLPWRGGCVPGGDAPLPCGDRWPENTPARGVGEEACEPRPQHPRAVPRPSSCQASAG